MRKTILPIALLVNMAATAQEQFKELDYTPSQSTFTLNAPTKARAVKVRIYDSAQAPQPVKTLNLRRAGEDRWSANLSGDWAGHYYTFDVGQGECPGTFAKAVGINGKRAAIIDLAQTDPQGWSQDQRPPLRSPSDLVVYEMHHRDFSIHPSRGSRYPGKYLALTEPHNIWYLKTLGINAVQILPSYDYYTVDESHPERPQYNWGYDPLNYNVPEGSYSTDATRPDVRIREFKQMVRALHSAGIRVILDVVYNHCMDIAGSNFQRTYPDYYFRKSAPGQGASGEIGTTGGDWANASGCGNETASERQLMRQFMIESVRYWVTEYHIDGFRFDLMGIHDIETMNQIRAELDKIDPSITIYGEGWAAGAPAIDPRQCAMKSNISSMPHIGAFADEMRDALRGPFSDDREPAYLAARPGHEESIKFGLVGGISHPEVDMTKVNYSKTPWASQPTQHVSYVSCHDDMSLVDRLRASISGISDDQVVRLSQLAQTFVLTSQGIPFIWAGEEAFRDKQGVHNSYNQPDSINQIDWNRLRIHPELFLYYKGLIDIRRSHRAFRMSDADLVRRHLHFLPAPDCVIAFTLDGQAVGDSWSQILCIMNSNPQPRKLTIPQGNYTIVCRQGLVNKDGLGQMQGGEIEIAPQSALIIHK